MKTADLWLGLALLALQFVGQVVALLIVFLKSKSQGG